MEFVGFALAIVAFGVAAWLWRRSSVQAQDASRRQSQLEGELDTQRDLAKQSGVAAEEASEQVKKLEAELADALARSDHKAITTALWQLELERSHRQWMDVIVPAHAERSVESVTAGEQLTFAISQEVERLREEVGVSIRFDGGFDVDLEAESALAALRITEELLALTAKLSDEVIVSLDQLDGEEALLSIVIECVGWDDEEGTPEEMTSELSSTVDRLQGTLVWEELSGDGLRANLRLPAPIDDEAIEDGASDKVEATP